MRSLSQQVSTAKWSQMIQVGEALETSRSARALSAAWAIGACVALEAKRRITISWASTLSQLLVVMGVGLAACSGRPPRSTSAAPRLGLVVAGTVCAWLVGPPVTTGCCGVLVVPDWCSPRCYGLLRCGDCVVVVVL